MRNVLLVANRALGAEALWSWMAEAARRDVVVFRVVVPVRVPAPGEFAAAFVGSVPFEYANPEPYLASARQHVQSFVDEARWLGFDAVGDAAVGDPFHVVLRCVGEVNIDEVVLASSANAVARTLRVDLATRLRRRLTMPVHEVGARRVMAA